MRPTAVMYWSRQTVEFEGPASFAMLIIEARSYFFHAATSATHASTSEASVAAKVLSPTHVASQRPGITTICAA